MGRNNNSNCRISSYEPNVKPNQNKPQLEPTNLLTASQRRLNKWGDGVVIEPDESYYKNMASDDENNNENDNGDDDDEEHAPSSSRKHKNKRRGISLGRHRRRQEEEDDADVELKYASYDPNGDEASITSQDVYIVKQNYGYFSILFSIVQTIILGIMMFKCGVAPLQLNFMVGPYPHVLSEWGAKNAVLILDDGEWWRLLSPVLLHAGIIHLLCNVGVQLETGVFFEKEWGSGRWLIVYLLSGVGSSILSVIVKPDALSVGSSGAIMGLFGAKLSEIILRACERVRTRQDKVGQQVRKEQCCAVSVSVVLIMACSFIPYVDWAAHLGGLVAGLLIGIVIFAWQLENWWWKISWSIAGLALTVVSYAAAISYMYSGLVVPMQELGDVCAYYQDYYKQTGQDYECTCQRQQE